MASRSPDYKATLHQGQPDLEIKNFSHSMSVASQQLDENRDECWPDWVSHEGAIVADDVSRTNATKVGAIYQPRNLDDVLRIVNACQSSNVTLTVRGTKHSMGGHTLTEGGVIMDMEYINHMKYDESSQSVVVGTGAQWAHLIEYLNHFGKAPKTLQSYCSFSVGGTLSVNGHGVTSDFCVAESVISFRLVKYDGTIVECSRDGPTEESRELFKCCIGGYGLFGIIFDVALKVVDNHSLFLDTIMVPLQDVPIMYQQILSSNNSSSSQMTNDIDVKLTRINITNFEQAEIYLFRRLHDTCTVSRLPSKPNEMSTISKTMYKWFAGPLREVRFAIENQFGVALDWGEVLDRNQLLYESATSLAKLYSPILLVDDTFILQEYFVPFENFNTWMVDAKSLVLDHINHESILTLLNITIRVVLPDKDSILPYSSSKEGCFAFVLYYRIQRTAEASNLLAHYHYRFAEITLQENGTFYLPYKHHYTKEQLYRAYPTYDKFVELKRKYDPESRFCNLWWLDYAESETGPTSVPIEYPETENTFGYKESQKQNQNAKPSESSKKTKKDRKEKKKEATGQDDEKKSGSTDSSIKKKKKAKNLETPAQEGDQSNPSPSSSSAQIMLESGSSPLPSTLPSKSNNLKNFENQFYLPRNSKLLSGKELDDLFAGVSVHRTDSFRKLMSSAKMRQDFLDIFLEEILNLGDKHQILRNLNLAVWDPRLKDDDQIYLALADKLKAGSGPFTQLMKSWKDVRQLSNQKKELVRETVSVLNRAGFGGKIHTMASIGDHGKLVVPLRKALDMKGHVWIVHDREGSDSDLAASMERGSVKSTDIGEFVQIDYKNLRKDGREFASIPDNSVDLATMNQGLHHLPPTQIKHFLAGIHRILRPGGCLIIREHDLDEKKELMPMLDCAHMVFNVLTGELPTNERNEIRGFRSCMEWRLLVESCGFQDSMIYEIQPHDPTIDVMMAFIKLPTYPSTNTPHMARASDQTQSPKGSKSVLTASRKPYGPHTQVTESSQLQTLPKDINTVGANATFSQVPNFGLSALKGALQYLQTILPDFEKKLYTGIDAMLPTDLPGLGDALKVLIKNYVGPALMMLARFEPLTENATPNPNFTAEYLYAEELSLLIQVLRNKAKAGGLFESAIVSVLDKFLKKLTPKQKKQPKEGSSIDGEQSNPVDPERNVDGSWNLNELNREFGLLLDSFPEFEDLHSLVKNFGLSNQASKLICSVLPKQATTESLTNFAVSKLDDRSWKDLKAALKKTRESHMQAPTLKDLTTYENPWQDAILAIFSSPKIQLTKTQIYMSSYIGLGEFTALWTKAQDMRKSEDYSGTKPGDSGTVPVSRLEAKAQNIFDEMCPVITYEGKEEITNVLHIISATYIRSAAIGFAKDATIDITEAAREAVDRHGHLNCSDIQIQTPSFRLGAFKFVITYRKALDATVNTSTLRKAGTNLSKVLANCHCLDGTHNSEKENLTFFKLSEWMQVEIVQMFGNSMVHTPWYRFPFIGVMMTYFEVLFKEVSVVAEKHGWLAAISDQGFMIDVIPGVVMALQFAQMQLLALPLKAVLGASYDASRLVEQILIVAPPETDWNQDVDERIKVITRFKDGLSVLQIPTFKPFTQVLTSIALKSPNATILQISNHSVVQVKLEVSLDAVAAVESTFTKMKGVKINFNYSFPSVSSNPTSTSSSGASSSTTSASVASSSTNEMENPPTFISLTVQVPALLNVLRKCDVLEFNVAQVYDFF